jgi:hypothetical protein
MTVATGDATELAAAHTDATQVIVRRAAEAVQAAWRDVPPAQVAAQFGSRILPVLVGAITAGQGGAAALAQPYVDTAMDGTGDTAMADTVPASFAGMTAGGMTLDWLAGTLYAWLTQAIGAGMSATDASTAGLQRAITYVSTEINDAGRSATQVAETAHPGAAGHERVVHLPACDRCIVLAGKFYRYSSGFLRHPRCDCTMIPVSRQQWENGRPENTPDELFASMSEAEQNKRFGTANAETLRMGGDMAQVVNARAGMATVKAFGRNMQVTSYGTTKRALFGGYEIQADGTLRKRTDRELAHAPGKRYRVTKAPRLTPGEIFRLGDEFGWDREELVRQLRRFAYVR